MPLTQVLQGPGHFSIELDGDRLPVPRALTDLFPVATEGFGHIVVTSARIDPADQDPGSILQLATYVGRYIGQKGRTELYGDHINAWLGDSEGKGYTAPNDITANQGFTAWIDDLQPDQVPFYQGSIGTPGFTLDYTWALGTTQREGLEVVCKWFGCEWRVNNTFTFDADIWTNLYGATPTAIATPWWDGRDTELAGLRATIVPETTLDRYAYGIYGVSKTGVADFEIDPSFPFDLPPSTLPGFFPGWKYLSGSASMATADLSDLFLNEGAERWARNPTLKLRTDDFCPLDTVAVGAPLYVFDPDGDVYDFANEVHYGGHILWPKALRVQAIVDMPVREGMGVYFRTATEIFDLTDYVKFETGSTRIEVGERVRTLRPSVKRRGYDA